MIEFLQDYTTEAMPPESFKKGQQVTRSEGSEGYFVGRGLAGYVVDGKLFDDHYRPIIAETAAVEIVTPGDRRADLAVRAGEVMTGQPPRATSGPGVPFVEAATGTQGVPSVVLEAEIERLKDENARLQAGVTDAGDQFRSMNNSHVAEKDGLRSDLDRITRERDLLTEANVTANNRVTELTTQFEGLNTAYETGKADLAERDARIAELEQQLADAHAHASKSTKKA